MILRIFVYILPLPVRCTIIGGGVLFFFNCPSDLIICDNNERPKIFSSKMPFFSPKSQTFNENVIGGGGGGGGKRRDTLSPLAPLKNVRWTFVFLKTCVVPKSVWHLCTVKIKDEFVI